MFSWGRGLWGVATEGRDHEGVATGGAISLNTEEQQAASAPEEGAFILVTPPCAGEVGGT